MPSVGKGVFEIRIGVASGAYRVFYVSVAAHGLVVFHAFPKKAQKTPQREIETGQARLKAFLNELEE